MSAIEHIHKKNNGYGCGREEREKGREREGENKRGDTKKEGVYLRGEGEAVVC